MLRLRRRMDRLDRKLAGLLLERLQLSFTIIDEKVKLGLPIRDRERERDLINSLKEALASDRPQSRLLRRVYRELLSMTVELAAKR